DPFILNDLRHFLQKCMQALPSLQREAVELAFFKGLSHSEIAAATNAPLGTVKTRLELGLQKLTHALRPLRHKVGVGQDRLRLFARRLAFRSGATEAELPATKSVERGPAHSGSIPSRCYMATSVVRRSPVVAGSKPE